MNTNKKFIIACAAVAVAASAALTLVPGDLASATTVSKPGLSAPTIPGTSIPVASPVRWNDSGAAYTVSGGAKVVTRFYGYRACFYDDYNSTAGTLCFTIRSTDRRVIILFPDTKTKMGAQVVTSVKN